jgi:hypothetical protein
MLSKLNDEQRLAGLAAAALLVTMILPWYQKSVAVENRLVDDSLSAFSVFSFVEAAVFVVVLGVFALLHARVQEKGFHLPGGDGTVIAAAGIWAAVLLLWRVFDRPDVEGRGATVGISWGFFFAFVAAAALAVAGLRMRAAHTPEPPNPMAAPEPQTAPRTARTRRAPREDPPTAVTEYLPDREAEQLTLPDVPPYEPPPPRRRPPDRDEPGS